MGIEIFVENYSNFTEVEKKIAKDILTNPENFTNSSAATIADQLYISKTSLINFAKKLGFQGFSELKYFVKSQLNTSEDKKEKDFDILVSNLQTEFEKSIKLIDETLIKEFCEYITQSNRLYIASRGASKQFAQLFCNRLNMLGIPSIFIDDFNLINVLKDHLTENDTVLLISLSGKTKILVSFAEYILSSSAKLISITGFNNNPIQSLSHHHLSFYSDVTDTAYKDIHSRLGMQMVLQLIVDYIYNKS